MNTISAATLALVGLALVATALAFAVATEPGPLRVVVLWRRYGSMALLPAVPLTLAALALWRPALAATAVAVPLALAATRPSSARMVWRRGVLRARWVSVARATDLGTVGDRRSATWPGGAVITVIGERVEWLPALARGRTVDDHTAEWLVRPARGRTLGDVVVACDALEAALGCSRVEVFTEAPSRGRLVARW